MSVLFLCALVQAQTLRPVQWASSVLDVSSEYAASPANYSADKLLGKPEAYPQCGSNPDGWAPATQNGQREFFELGFATPQKVNNIRIYQSWGPGAVDTVYVRQQGTTTWKKVYEATAVNQAACPGIDEQLLEINIATTTYNVDAVRVAINSPFNTNWNEFDAVSIANFDVMPQNITQYVSEVLRFSSEYNPSPGNYSAFRIIGAPNAAAACVTDVDAWTPLTQSSQREWIEVKYQYPAITNRVTIYQQIAPGAVDTVYLRNATTGVWNKIYTATAAEETYCIASKKLEINFTKTTYPVDAVRIALNSPEVTSYWNEIDAVSLQCDLGTIDAANLYTKASGDWNDAGTWLNGAVPTAADKVVILGGHNVTLDANGVAKNITVENSGELTIAKAGTTLRVGNFNTGGGNDSVVIRGNFTMSDGALNIGGRLKEYSIAGNSYVQSGGIIRIDGNTGNAATSVADDDYLLEVNVLPPNTSLGYTYNPSGGTLLFVDPPKGASGNLMYYRTLNAALGANHTVQYGDGVSTTAGGNAQGFTNNTFASVYGMVINNPSGTNRTVTDSRCTQIKNLTVTAGTLNSSTSFAVQEAAVNDGTVMVTGSSDFQGGITNNGTITVNNIFSADDDVTNNNGASITAPSFYFTKNLVNNGTITVNTDFGFQRGYLSRSTAAQALSGTGVFDIASATLRINNNNAAGITLNRSLTVTDLNFVEGKVYLGSNDITFNAVTGGTAMGASDAYFITAGTGRLKFTNLTTAEVLFSVGTATSYLPVRIKNGSGHTFSVGVKGNFSVAPPGTQHVKREWDIDDETGGAVSATVTFQWNEADEDATFNRNACAIAHYNGAEWSSIGTAGAATGSDPYTRTATGVGSFSPFTVSSNNVVLPVTLTRFWGAQEVGGVRLRWQTEAETNLAYFEVERSGDARLFSSLAKIAAKNTPGANGYEAVDAAALPGAGFYRLKMVDLDGRFKLSGTVKVEGKERNRLLISPNPARGEVSIQWDKKPTAITVLDMSGRTVLRLQPNASNRYRLHSLKAGTYFIKAEADGASEVKTLVVQ